MTSWLKRLVDRSGATPPADALALLEAHVIVRGPMPARCALTAAEVEAIEEDERASMTHGPEIAAKKLVPDSSAVIGAIDLLGRERRIDAVPVLCDLWRGCSLHGARLAAGEALERIGTAEAHAALQTMIDDWDQASFFRAMRSLLSVDPHAAYERTAARAREAKAGVAVAQREVGNTLAALCPPDGPHDRQRHPLAPDIMATDPRWLVLAGANVDDPVLGGAARAFLRKQPAAARDEALQHAPPRRAVSPYREAAPRADQFARWSRGQHDAWDELARLGAIEGDLRREAEAMPARSWSESPETPRSWHVGSVSTAGHSTRRSPDRTERGAASRGRFRRPRRTLVDKSSIARFLPTERRSSPASSAVSAGGSRSLNARKHGDAPSDRRWIDPMSSAATFDGWANSLVRTTHELPTWQPRSWLLRIGWRRAGPPIGPDETPGPWRQTTVRGDP